MEVEKEDYLASVKHIILVQSGKGGVGKSTVATQVALGLRQAGKRVGLLDIDLCGPSIPRMFNAHKKDVHQCSEGWVPVYTDQECSLAVMSIGFLLGHEDDAVVWRGPKKNAMIKQFLTDVYWNNIDYLIIDTPPGTSDEHITVIENIKKYHVDGVILVTTPQAVSVGDVRREVTFCKKMGVKIIGVVENMSGFVCPHCQECTNIFSSGGGKLLAEQCGITFLGRIPTDPQLTQSLEEGKSFIDLFPQSGTYSALMDIVKNLLE